MAQSINPYESPGLESRGGETRGPRKPVTPKVVGIIALVFGGLGLVGQAMVPLMMLVLPADVKEIQRASLAQGGYSMGYLIAMTVVGAIMSIWLISSGIGLLKYRRWGRLGFNVYAVLGILMALYGVYSALTRGYPILPDGSELQMQSVSRVSGVVSNLIGMLYPVLGLIFLNRSKVVAWLK